MIIRFIMNLLSVQRECNALKICKEAYVVRVTKGGANAIRSRFPMFVQSLLIWSTVMPD